MATGSMAGKRGLIIGGAATYLLSDLSGGATRKIHYADVGFNVAGMKLLDNVAPRGERIVARRSL